MREVSINGERQRISYHFRQPTAKAKTGALSKEAEFVGKDF